MQEATEKTNQYDLLQKDFTITVHERDELMRANNFLEKKLTETS